MDDDVYYLSHDNSSDEESEEFPIDCTNIPNSQLRDYDCYDLKEVTRNHKVIQFILLMF